MIYKYEVINPVTNRKKPFVDARGFFVIPNIGKHYYYYVEVRRYNNQTFNYDYYVLLSNTKFDNNCLKCRVDDYGRLKLKLHKELKDYVNTEINVRGNVEFEYYESEGQVDVWCVI